MKLPYPAYLVVLILTAVLATAQNRQIDSLKKTISTSAEDTSLVKTLNNLAWEYAIVDDYASSRANYEKALRLSFDKKFEAGIFRALYIKYRVYKDGVFKSDSALLAIKEMRRLAEKFSNKMALWQSWTYESQFHNDKSDFSKSVECAINALRVAEEIGNKRFIGGSHHTLGVAYVYLQDNISGLKEYEIARKYYEELKDTAGVIRILFVIGNAYANMQDVPKALESHLKCKELALLRKDFSQVVFSDNELGGLYMARKEFAKAREYFTNNYNHFKKIKAKEPLINTCVKIINALNYLNKYEETFPFIKEVYELGVEEKNSGHIATAYDYFSGYYSRSGNYQKAYESLRRHKQITDSMNQDEFKSSMAEMAKKYESEKKDKELLQKESQIKVEQADGKNKSMQRNIFIGGFGIMALMAVVVLRGYNQKRKANIQISSQKHVIEEKQKEILDSIHYAQRIQKTLLASKEFLDENVKDSFILFKPKDIVSGDFFWAATHNDRFFLAVCDSTGHGVPGAFMSLLSIGFLSEAIKENDIAEPGEVFNHVRKRLEDSISKDGQKDGFDGILLCIDKRTKKVSYASSNNKPVIVSNGVLAELPGDKMPVGKGDRAESFKTYPVDLKGGEILYLYTDGYPDQFGGPKGKKFKYKQLDDLLLSLSDKPMEEQQAVLETEFKTWKGQLEQVDDVCIVGLRV